MVINEFDPALRAEIDYRRQRLAADFVAINRSRLLRRVRGMARLRSRADHPTEPVWVPRQRTPEEGPCEPVKR